MQKTLDVVFTADQNYLTHWCVALYSLIVNNRAMPIQVHLVYDNMHKQKLFTCKHFFEDNFDITISLYPFTSDFMENFKISHHINTATYFRLCLADLLPQTLDRVLFLDCDLVVHESLENLNDIVFDDDTYLCAVEHRMDIENKRHLSYFDLSADVEYFNAGVMLINLKTWREKGLTATFLQFASREKENILWWDQDVLNVCSHGKWKTLPPKYNVIWEIIEADSKSTEILEAQEKPVIIHYTRSIKPWHINSWHPYKELYWGYRTNIETLIKEIA